MVRPIGCVWSERLFGTIKGRLKLRKVLYKILTNTRLYKKK